MLLSTVLFTCLWALSWGAKCPNFPDVECKEPNGCRKDGKDWDLQALPLSGYAVFNIDVPQFRRQRTKEVVIGLLGSIVPNATWNFAQFSAGGIRVGTGPKAKVLKYQGTPFHRIVKNEFITGGDVLYQNGSGTIAANGAFAIPPDNFYVSNYGKGWVGMKQLGPEFNHSIGSQFFISLTNDRKLLHNFNRLPILHLGKVVKGFDLIDRINQRAGAKYGGGKIALDDTKDPVFDVPLLRPKKDITISSSKYVTLEDGVKKGYPPYAFNRPTTGCLSGRWPRK